MKRIDAELWKRMQDMPGGKWSDDAFAATKPGDALTNEIVQLLRRLTTTRLFGAVLLLLTCLYANNGRACTCVTVPLKRAFLGSDVVFVGTVIDERGFTRPDQSDREGKRQYFIPTDVVVRVQRSFVGGVEPMQEVRLDSCGVLTKGRAYLIFASRHNDIPQNRGCLTQAVDDEKQTLRRVERRARMWRIERRFRNWWNRLLEALVTH